MVEQPASRSRGLAPATLLIAGLPLLLGQGCPGTGGPIQPITPDSSNQSPVSPATGNVPPSLSFIAPVVDVSGNVGDVVTLRWVDADPDNNAVITLLLVREGQTGAAGEVLVAPPFFEDPDDDETSGEDRFTLDTGSLNLQPASYRVVARINDGVNPEKSVVAPGKLILLGGFLPGNVSPRVTVVQPTAHMGVGENDLVPLEYCAEDPDDDSVDPLGRFFVPDVIVLLDEDSNPTNDLDLTGSDAEAALADACFSNNTFPFEIDGAIVLGCFKDDDCQNPLNATLPAISPPPAGNGQLLINTTRIPPRASGEPYLVRVTMWDHANRPVHAYAPGSISVTSFSSGVVDLAQVGRTISGTKFKGFSPGDLAGSTGVSTGDFDGDGASDFIIVARFGRPLERGNLGTAYLVYGIPGQKFGSEVSLNSVSTDVRGATFIMGMGFPEAIAGPVTGTEGITSVAIIPDLNFDGRPELLFGAPYVEIMYDHFDDDPIDMDDLCYGDFMPNPLSDSGNPDDMTNFDIREGVIPNPVDPMLPGIICSNDLDLIATTPIDQGYVIYVRSDNPTETGGPLEGTVIDLPLTGMQHPPPIAISNDEFVSFLAALSPNGARFRGGWYDDFDLTQTVRPYALIPDNEFGRTVASMPDMTYGDQDPAPDGRPELLVSAPNAYRGRGGVYLIFGQEYHSFGAAFDPIKSLPVGRTGGFPVDRRIRGSAIGDRLGFAGPAGDYNLDGVQDILCGAAGADRNGINDGGIVYVLFGRLDFGEIELETDNPPRMEIHGTTPNDRFGEMQTLVGDLNQDGLPDIGFSSGVADGPLGVDSGVIAVVFGGRPLTGENVFTVGQVATPQLPGFKIFGAQAGGQAGAILNNAGDYNGDGTDDMVIVAPNETRTVGGQLRRGVAYVVFGGLHLANRSFNLTQVGTSNLPGSIIVSPYAAGTADEAPIDWAGSAGDVNADGFDDLLVGVSTADFVNPLEPGQRRVDSGECYLLYGSNSGTNALP